VLIWVKNNETVNSVDKDNEIVFKLFANGSVEGRILVGLYFGVSFDGLCTMVLRASLTITPICH